MGQCRRGQTGQMMSTELHDVAPLFFSRRGTASTAQAAAPTLATTGWGRSALCSEVAQVDVRSKAATAAPGADNRTKGEADELEKIKYSTYTVLLTWSILQTSPCQESVWQVIRSASTSHT
ncbi:uncharacterized protein LOC119320217 isoform X10 [Triticum dicoccoides]|uniref:uncharacterized protein LOC119320217 isoform X10 n=1 Tax=Triticum dicoccoides TaxID=85692 RepID=UPI00188F3C2A|nr:uncharacterized protein LOC119320217 isoform X10 [Triticum dicoccoides]XP_037450291.1 uncharacterized protein LOC119320217 isoform X10 [Triticum dicoccoides]XP_037450294.1 uncharacterized protein LOC119320217 isoform X10 [Triticum dicoccoides]XP_037450299.1 uncharacterized protein LOC119320217 isoform X10 [Triticum dicoccoides]XP_037450304.1 uncharacterized protein LOC119320217 isoform X10 [Triticum dicoccoides]